MVTRYENGFIFSFTGYEIYNFGCKIFKRFIILITRYENNFIISVTRYENNFIISVTRYENNFIILVTRYENDLICFIFI